MKTKLFDLLKLQEMHKENLNRLSSN